MALSGGIDSSVVGALAVRAVGPERVLGLLLPERDSSAVTNRLGAAIVENLGVEALTEDITPILADPALFDRNHPDLSAWSCGQHAAHAVMVAQTIVDRIEGNLAEPSQNQEEATPELAHRVLSAGRFPRGSATSPTDVHPESRPREEFQPLLPAAIESWGRIQARADELPACPARYPHFRLGYLTSVEWVRMCAVHTAHHLAIVHDISDQELS